MESVFKPIEQEKFFLQILSQLKEKIRVGEIKKGDRLPAERQLAASLGVSRVTVREAIRAMELIGLVKCVQGDGNYITAAFDNSLIEPLSLMFLLNNGDVGKVLELRIALEVMVVQLAANCITPDEVRQLGELCAAVENETDKDKQADLDQRFHYQISVFCGNSLISNVLNAASVLIANQIRDTRSKMPDENDLVNAQHRAIVQALADRDPEAAKKAMLTHIDLILAHMSTITGGE